MSYDGPDNPYYHPENLDLELIDSFDFGTESYSFDLMVAWKHKLTGTIYYATDSGCSCPAPFEYATLADLTALESWDSIIPVVDALVGPQPDPDDRWPSVDEWQQIKAQATDFITKVRAAVHGG